MRFKAIIQMFLFWDIPGFDEEAEYKIKKHIMKYVNQWYFIGSTQYIVGRTYKVPDILKRARGKFVPWSEAKRWYFFVFFDNYYETFFRIHLSPQLKTIEHPSEILCEGFKWKMDMDAKEILEDPLLWRTMEILFLLLLIPRNL